MNIHKNEFKRFETLNGLANMGGTVIIGSTFANAIPANELKQTYNIDCDVYNRSIADLTIFEASELIQKTMEQLKPSRILLNLGETDLELGFSSVKEIVECYEKIINMIHNANKHCKIVIVSVCDNEYNIQPNVLNRGIEALSRKYKCQYADITSASGKKFPALEAFRALKYFMTGSMTFADAVDDYNNFDDNGKVSHSMSHSQYGVPSFA